MEGASLFEASSPELLELANRVMEKCVLEKIMAPTPPLENAWVVPGGPYYRGQWIWGTMFVVDLLSLLPGKQKLIRDIFLPWSLCVVGRLGSKDVATQLANTAGAIRANIGKQEHDECDLSCENLQQDHLHHGNASR